MKNNLIKILAITVLFSAIILAGIYTHGTLGVDLGGVNSSI